MYWATAVTDALLTRRHLQIVSSVLKPVKYRKYVEVFPHGFLLLPAYLTVQWLKDVGTGVSSSRYSGPAFNSQYE